MNCERRGGLSGVRARCSVRLWVMRLCDKARKQQLRSRKWMG